MERKEGGGSIEGISLSHYLASFQREEDEDSSGWRDLLCLFLFILSSFFFSHSCCVHSSDVLCFVPFIRRTWLPIAVFPVSSCVCPLSDILGSRDSLQRSTFLRPHRVCRLDD